MADMITNRTVTADRKAVGSTLSGHVTSGDLVAVTEMRLATAKRLMAAGVTIFRPETCVIDAAVEVAFGVDWWQAIRLQQGAYRHS